MIKNLKSKLLIFILGVTGAVFSFAQGGSNYSIYGIGDIYPGGNASFESLGGTSIAVPSDFGVNMRNPSLWSFTKTSRLQAGFRFNQNSVNNGKYSLFQNNGKVDGIFGIFSVDTSIGLSVSFGVHPYSSVNYLIKTENSVEIDTTEAIAQTTFNGSGGLSNAYLGASFKLFNGLNLGGEVHATFGLIETQITTIFPTNSYAASISIRDDNFFGFGYKAGAYYSGIENLGIGAYLEGHPNTTVDSKLYYTYLTMTKDTLIQNPEYSVKIPLSIGFGLSYTLGKFLFAADYIMQDFSDFDYNVDTNHAKPNYKKSSQLSFGISRLGNKSINAKFLDKINYNFGFGYRELYINTFGKDINEYYGSFGMDMPVIGSAMVNFAFTIGSRGTTDAGLVRELFGRLTVDLSIGEIWFVPYRRNQ
ncbi:MAG: hypothetical protein HZB41_11085 [Ignavibacteriae bacterium]|nr:hypothetical protein [Ignavibacteriota bacterium]